LPATPAELSKIPGIGRYTAGAIASLAFGLREPVVDGNVARVLCRFRDWAGDTGKAPLRERLWSLARQLVDHGQPGAINESLMELGATLCTKHDPQCRRCPIFNDCLARKRNRVHQRPAATGRPKVLHRDVLIIVATQGARRVLVCHQEPRAQQWASLWTFPFVAIESVDAHANLARQWLRSQLHCVVTACNEAARGKYAITRFRVSFVAIKATVAVTELSPLPARHAWKSLAQLHALPMPAPHRKLVQQLLQPTTDRVAAAAYPSLK